MQQFPTSSPPSWILHLQPQDKVAVLVDKQERIKVMKHETIRSDDF